MTTFDDFKADLALFDDWEDRYRALIDLGRTLEPLPEAARNEANKVRGCSSQVWLTAEPAAGGALHLRGDSDAHIVRGLVALLFLLYQDRTPDEIRGIDARARLAELGLAGHLSPTRTNGLYSMVERIRAMAAEGTA
ncbi:MAG: SufE family protein [Sphingomonadales bacterium]|nr:MAG: SufE family protein [Sphingomonadales bacterium]